MEDNKMRNKKQEEWLSEAQKIIGTDSRKVVMTCLLCGRQTTKRTENQCECWKKFKVV